MLIQAGHDPATPAEAWRGETLCLHIRSIGEAAELSISEPDAGWGPRFRPYNAHWIGGGIAPEFSLDSEDDCEKEGGLTIEFDALACIDRQSRSLVILRGESLRLV